MENQLKNQEERFALVKKAFPDNTQNEDLSFTIQGDEGIASLLETLEYKNIIISHSINISYTYIVLTVHVDVQDKCIVNIGTRFMGFMDALKKLKLENLYIVSEALELKDPRIEKQSRGNFKLFDKKATTLYTHSDEKSVFLYSLPSFETSRKVFVGTHVGTRAKVLHSVDLFEKQSMASIQNILSKKGNVQKVTHKHSLNITLRSTKRIPKKIVKLIKEKLAPHTIGTIDEILLNNNPDMVHRRKIRTSEHGLTVVFRYGLVDKIFSTKRFMCINSEIPTTLEQWEYVLNNIPQLTIYNEHEVDKQTISKLEMVSSIKSDEINNIALKTTNILDAIRESDRVLKGYTELAAVLKTMQELAQKHGHYVGIEGCKIIIRNLYNMGPLPISINCIGKGSTLKYFFESSTELKKYTVYSQLPKLLIDLEEILILRKEQ